MTPPLWQKPNSLLMKVKKEGEKVGFKFNIQKTKFMASGPITSWQIDTETVTDFILLHWKITEDANYSLEIKRHLIFGRKTITNLDSILKSRDITLPTKVCLVKALVFSSSHIWIWEFDYKESWVLKNWCFWTVVLVFFGRNDAKAETPIIWPPDARNWLTGRNPDAGKDWHRRRRGWQRMRQLDSITDSMDMILSKLQKWVMDREALSATVHGIAKSWTQLSYWTDWYLYS